MQAVGLLLFLSALFILTGCDSSPVPAGKMVEPPPRSVNQAQLSHGKRIYEKLCETCHGKNGVGALRWRIQGPDGRWPAPPLDGSGHAWHHPTFVLIDVIKNGSPGGMGNMPAYRDELSEADMIAIIEYFKSLWSDDVYAAWYQIEQQSGAEH